MLAEGVLISPDLLDGLASVDFTPVQGAAGHESSPFVVSKDTLDVASSSSPQQILKMNWPELERARTVYEKTDDNKVYDSLLKNFREQRAEPEQEEAQSSEIPISPPEVVHSFEREGHSWGVKDFVSHFRVRFQVLSNILRDRPELANTTAIGRVSGKKNDHTDGPVALIGMVREKRETRNKNLMLLIEDQTGLMRVLVNKSKQEIFTRARDLVQDEIVGITGTKKGEIVFVNDVIIPGVPLGKELKKLPIDCSAAVISDIHVGSMNFLEEEFEQFINWICGEAGTEEQRAVAKDIKYLFILGDLVAGIGIYPGQEDELTIHDLEGQFNKIASYLKRIPEHIHIVIISGNHDGVRLAEPQPPLDKKAAAALYEIPNALILSNPAWVRLFKTADFPGFDFLLYHGYSFIYYADNVNSLRQAGGVDKAGDIMNFLIQRRHLAPAHGSTLYLPDPRRDPLLIKNVPDFFLCGHIHKSEVTTSNGTTLICGSCWESQTSFEKKLGLHPEPGRVPIINFRTRQVKVLKFIKEEQ